MMALLFVSIILGMSAPLMSKKIERERANVSESANVSYAVPSGAIMFFERSSCPDGWTVVDAAGHYPRIAEVNNQGKATDVGSTLEQMVHRHKHVSPFMQALNSSALVNSFRYGPFRNLSSYSEDKNGGKVLGDGYYPILEASRLYVNSAGEAKKNAEEVDYKITGTAGFLLRAISTGGGDFNNWYMFTSDGENRVEALSVAGPKIVNLPICPNRTEDSVMENTCKSGYSYVAYNQGYRQITVKNQPYLENMAIVGGENRPNSIIWLACKKD